MKYGLHLAGGASVCDRKILRDVAQCAEGCGYDAVVIGDHIALPTQIESPWPYEEYNDGRPLYTIYTDMEWLDPFDTVAFLAGVTETVRLGLSVLIVPYRHPFDVARRVATIDVLSGGRFVLGCGVGWLEEEFELLGVPFARRGARTDEYIDVMKAIWSEEDPRFEGEFVRLDRGVNVTPRPLQRPHPPIWIGGETLPALRRVVARGDGWHIGLLTDTQRREMLDHLRRMMDEAGRDYDALELSAITDPVRFDAAAARRLRDDGVGMVFTAPLGREPDRIEAQVRDFADMMRDL